MARIVGARVTRLAALVALVLTATALFFSPTTNAHAAANNHLSALLVAEIGALLAIVALLSEARRWRETRAQFRSALQTWLALRHKDVMSLPTLPRQRVDLLDAATSQKQQMEVADFIRQMVEIRWESAPLREAGAQSAFQQAALTTSRAAGDWSKLREPIMVFASLPAPWCYIGAARVMGRISLVMGHTYSPRGLLQGLRFIAKAQAIDPTNVEALLTRATLLAHGDDPRWLKQAEEALARARSIAPEHPELPAAEAVYFNHLGQGERALSCAEQAMARSSTPEEQLIARITYVNTLLDLQRWEAAAAGYRDLLRMESDDPWLWHNLSIANLNMELYDEAERCNQRALSIMRFHAADLVGETIRKRLRESRALATYA